MRHKFEQPSQSPGRREVDVGKRSETEKERQTNERETKGAWTRTKKNETRGRLHIRGLKLNGRVESPTKSRVKKKT